MTRQIKQSQISDKQIALYVELFGETSTTILGAGARSIRSPIAFTLTELRAHVNTAPVGSNLILDLNINGVTAMAVDKLSIDAGELTSLTATTPHAITNSAVGLDSVLTFDVDQIGATTPSTGLKCWIFGDIA